MLVPKYYEDLHMLHDNVMPNRSYYIPASGRKGDLLRHREESDRMQVLSGKWKFRYYESIYDLRERFFEQDYDAEGYDTVLVPGVWQNYGYDTHQYTNIRYPFPLDSPYVPQENPCGAYICEFFYQRETIAPKAYLNFEGVDSCFYVWLNGQYVGYSQVSHSTSEFDVTEYLLEGDNRLAVLVLKWCDGSYLEDQDKFRMSGIFRDVYLLKRPAQGIADYFTTTKCGDGKADVEIQVKYFDEIVPVCVSVYDADGKVVAMEVIDEAFEDGEGEYQQKICFTLENPHLWNAEEPYLYLLALKTEKETITDYIGIREIKICNNVVTINGSPVTFKGVNRHESDPVTGFTISMEQMEKDLLMMKQHNFNAIRTSHYPDVPMFYQLCDQYGFYVIDEADNEAHGPVEAYFEDRSWENRGRRWNELIADNPEFTEATLDRIKRCVYRDKNRPCVVIWSMGNESAYGCTFEKSLEWVKQFDSGRLTHYESAYYRSKKRKYDFSNIDLYSMMYPTMEEIREYVEHQPDKPYIMCEYCHAMGNGPGDLEDYFKVIEQYEEICGGFVWEWCDHAVYKGKMKDGKVIYYYGGDHKEEIHDGNFCIDGLVYPDRRPHTGLLEYKNVYRPARVVSFDQISGRLVLHNYMDFLDLKDYLHIRYEVTCDGEVVEAGRVEKLCSVKPHREGEVAVHSSIPKKGRCFLKVYYDLKEAMGILPEGYLLGFDEIVLKNGDGRNQTCLMWNHNEEREGNVMNHMGQIDVTEDDMFLTLMGSCFAYSYNKLTGVFEQMRFEGQQIITRPMEVNIWRAPTDNDRNIKEEWLRAFYHQSYTRAYKTEYKRNQSSVEIRSTMAVVAATVQKILDIEAVWSISGRGEIAVKMSVKRNIEFPELPRFGLRLFLPKDMEDVTFYGMGPMESYRDKCRAASHGKYSMKVSKMHEGYIRPQENGSHNDCDYVVVKGRGNGMSAVSKTPFSFNASIYTQEELMEKKHDYELVPCGSTVLCLDYAQNGIGSNSCGPRLLEKYRLKEEDFQFEMKLSYYSRSLSGKS